MVRKKTIYAHVPIVIIALFYRLLITYPLAIAIKSGLKIKNSVIDNNWVNQDWDEQSG